MTSQDRFYQVKKVTDLIKEPKFTFSFEVTSDVSKEGLIDPNADPKFISVTWHAKSHKCKDLDIGPLKIGDFLRSQQKQVLMHLSCDMMKKHYLEQVLAYLQEKGICNLFLVLGESYDSSLSDFPSTLELIKYIREISGQYFCIGMAGFCDCEEDKIIMLKKKVDAGADFIITQAFFDAKAYTGFKARCEGAGIKIPIVAGIFPFENYRQLTNFVNLCKVKVSENLLEHLKNNEGNEIVGPEIVRNLVRDISSEIPSAHFHFFTLDNINRVCRILNEV